MTKSLREVREFVAKELGQDFYTDPRSLITKLPTGLYQLDHLLEGGLREGGMAEFSGPPASGKTFLANSLMAQAQILHPDKRIIYLDYEDSFDPDRSKRLGVDIDGVAYAQPDTMEEGYNGIINALDSDDEFSLIVIDSLSAMLPNKENEKSVGDSSVALQAMNNTQATRKLTKRLSKNRTTLVFTNQIRDNMSQYGASHKTSGGNAIKHHCNTRLSFSRLRDPDAVKEKSLDGREEKRENRFDMKVTLEKHRGRNERETCTFRYIFKDEDIDRMHDLTNYLKMKGMVETAGAWVKISGVEKKVQGRKGLYQYLNEYPEEVERLLSEAKENSG